MTPRTSSTDPRPDLLSLPREEAEAALAAHFRARGQGGYRVGQALAWIYERDVARFDEMTDLPTGERDALDAAFRLTPCEAAQVSRSADGTVKHLWRLADGELVESVLIPTEDRLTLCISSQAGCAMACVFCATGWSGYRRQLTPGEIVAQFRGARRWARENAEGWSGSAGMGPAGHEVTNIVFMGMGEPLMNPQGVFPALTLLNHAYGVGARRITVSTVGVVPGIDALAERPEQFRLAFSLHAPRHDVRQEIVPLEKKYPLPELLDALRRFDAAGGRRITLEYIMIDGVNDAPELAAELAAIAREFSAHVNLIPYNPIPGPDWEPSRPARLRAFAEVLERRGVNATVREPRGADIAAACGQLRAEHDMAAPKPYVELLGRRAKSGASTG